MTTEKTKKTRSKTRRSRRSKRNRFANNELSQLDFQERVMAEGLNPDNPLLERVRFLAIVASNLDEFFAVRVAQLKRQIEQGSRGKSPDGRTPRQTLKEIYKQLPKMYSRMHRCMSRELLPAMRREGIRIVSPDKLTDEENRYLDRYFTEEVYPVLTPLAIGPGHPFPILGPELTLFVETTSVDEGAIRPADRAVLQLPGNLERFIELPGATEGHRVLPMEEV
ncbi:MAG: RNA degradosome polyphosphate kinase, partial [Planctomycetota bacterium]